MAAKLELKYDDVYRMWSWTIEAEDGFVAEGRDRSLRKARKNIYDVVALRREVLTITTPAEHRPTW